MKQRPTTKIAVEHDSFDAAIAAHQLDEVDIVVSVSFDVPTFWHPAGWPDGKSTWICSGATEVIDVDGTPTACAQYINVESLPIANDVFSAEAIVDKIRAANATKMLQQWLAKYGRTVVYAEVWIDGFGCIRRRSVPNGWTPEALAADAELLAVAERRDARQAELDAADEAARDEAIVAATFESLS